MSVVLRHRSKLRGLIIAGAFCLGVLLGGLLSSAQRTWAAWGACPPAVSLISRPLPCYASTHWYHRFRTSLPRTIRSYGRGGGTSLDHRRPSIGAPSTPLRARRTNVPHLRAT